MTSDPAAPAPEWDDPDETAPLVHDATLPGEHDTTVRRARGGAAGSAAADADDPTVRSRRRASPSAEQAAAGPAVDEPAYDGSGRVASLPDGDALREPYAFRAAPVVVPREAGRSYPTAGPPVDTSALARRIRIKARRRTAAVAAASTALLVASATLLVLIVSGGV